VCRSLYQTLSAHGMRRPGLLRPQILSCVCDGVGSRPSLACHWGQCCPRPPLL
jgi:hypothetical protein